MSNYKNLDKYLEKKAIKSKEKTKVKEKDLTDEQIRLLTIKMLKDMGYIG